MWLKEYYEVLGAATKKAQAYTDQEVSKVRTKFAVKASYADLPNPGRTDTIYLIPKAGFVNVYDQYIYEEGHYTDIGDTELDLDSYATDLELSQGLATKVDKVEGYGLSKNDFTDAKDTKLAGIETGAQVNVTPDAALDKTSTNAIQNKAVTEKFEEVEAEILNEDKVAEGNPITIETGSIGIAKSTELTMSPIQDLHGYDKAWIGGMGKNKWSLGDLTTSTQSGVAISLAAGSYTFSAIRTKVGLNLSVRFNHVDSTSEVVLFSSFTGQNFTLSADVVSINYTIVNYQSGDSITNIQIESGSTATSYEPYANECPISGRTDAEIIVKDEDNVTQSTVTISFGQTIYSGKLDVETGLLTIEWVGATIDGNAVSTINGGSAADSLGGKRIDTNISGAYYAGSVSSDVAQVLSDKLEVVSSSNIYSGNPQPNTVSVSGANVVVLRYNGVNTKEDAQTELNANPVQVCYKLATPTTTTLTPAQVALIKGLNSISTDADSIKMTYTINDFVTKTEMNTALASKANAIDLNAKADLTSFGPLEIITASTNYAEGDYMIFEGKFCKASSAITAGDTLEIGTNLTETTIAAELLAIISQLPTT
jgi:hypothetical protein